MEFLNVTFEHLVDSNVSLEEWDCILRHHNDTLSEEGCGSAWDGVSCWPPTVPGSAARVRCMESLRRVRYDTTQEAVRRCLPNGTWAAKSDYSACTPLDAASMQVLLDVEDAFVIYCVGYGLSLIALASALFIFLYFRDLRCLRNSIHTHLLATYMCIDLTWIVTTALQTSTRPAANQAGCALVVLLTYFTCTNFFWMFVEGLYLYVLVVKTFAVGALRMPCYAAIGWGLPAVFVLPWAIVKHQRADPDAKECSWHKKDDFDYIFMGPILLVLLANVFFLGRIMWVLITKLRAATSLESQQYRKAAKALLVLIPLLGVTYVAVIVSPAHRTARMVFAYAQALLLSTQGFTVAVLYCFLNGEVRKSLRHHASQWRDQRGVRCSTDGGRLHPRTSCVSLSTSAVAWGKTYSPVPVRDEPL